MNSQIKYSVVVPVYRAERTLEKLVDHVRSSLGDRLDKIILVYDCGNPKSWDIISELAESSGDIVGVKLSRNFGQHNATICGFSFVESEYVFTIDEDLQHDPNDFQKLIDRQSSSKADLVYGVYKEKKHNPFRNVTSSILKKLLDWGIPELHKDYTSFRLIRTKIAQATIEMNNSYTFLDGYLTWITKSVDSVTVDHKESEAGKSSYSTKKLIEHSINIFVIFSRLPIRFLTYSSFLLFIASFGYAIYIVISALTIKNYDAGFPTIVSLIGFGFGFVLFGLGVIGEYIQRISQKTTNRPNFVISETKK